MKVLNRYTEKNRVRFLHGGKEYFDEMKKLIDAATRLIHLQTYIYEDDTTGEEIAEALMNASKRGVKVCLLVDGYASRRLSTSFIDKLKLSGIHFRFFEPIFRSSNFYFGRRLHQKVMVVDSSYALVGGINISDKYNDIDGHKGWLDFAIFTTGETARELCKLCQEIWSGPPASLPAAVCTEERLLLDEIVTTCLVRIRRNDWVRRKKQVSATYFEMFKNAKQTITVLCSYFLPGNLIRKQLINAARRGVKVKIVMAGRSDLRLAKYAERFIYKPLLDNGIMIYEYQQNILHGKIAVCDNEFVTIGSYNVNNLSAYASIELNLDVFDKSFAAAVSTEIEKIAETDCILITKEYFNRKRSLLQRFLQWISYETLRGILYVFTFYFKQRPG